MSFGHNKLTPHPYNKSPLTYNGGILFTGLFEITERNMYWTYYIMWYVKDGYFRHIDNIRKTQHRK